MVQKRSNEYSLSLCYEVAAIALYTTKELKHYVANANFALVNSKYHFARSLIKMAIEMLEHSFR